MHPGLMEINLDKVQIGGWLLFHLNTCATGRLQISVHSQMFAMILCDVCYMKNEQTYQSTDIWLGILERLIM